MNVARIRVGLLGLGVLLAATAYAAGTKKTAEECQDKDDCEKGHCYTKKDNSQVCVDCSASEIARYRADIQRYCKEEPRGCKATADEVAEEYFTTRIKNGEKCIEARDEENKRCWDGGDQGHQDAVTEAENAKKNCEGKLAQRKASGGLYDCPDREYEKKAEAVEKACEAYGHGCSTFKTDKAVVDCDAIEALMKKADLCVDAVDELDKDCLPKTSKKREKQFGEAVKAYDYCKKILEHKKKNKLCK